MKNDQNILIELSEISPFLAGINKRNVFSVPEGYFDSLSEDIQESIITRGLHKNVNHRNIQEVPKGYFDGLSAQIFQKIKDLSEEKNETAFDLMRIVGNDNIFTVPNNYFEELPAQILDRIKINKASPAKVVSIGKGWMRYAAAATVAVVVLVTSFFIVNTGDENGFSVVNSQTVHDPAALQFNSEQKFDEGIASLSDEEIENYLQDHGTILDNQLLIKNTDVSEMPDQSEYLMDEHALNNYLQKINNKSPEKQ